MASKGSVHPMNMKLAGENQTMLDRLDFFFGDPKHSLAVGAFLQKEAANFTGFSETNSAAGLEGFALFKRYGEMIDTLLTAFCEEEGMKLEEVASSCMAAMAELDGKPSQYICLPYICAALEMDAFVNLVYEMKDLQNYGFDDEEASEGEEEEVVAE